MADAALGRGESEDIRRRQLIQATIESLADVGFSACTLGDIAKRAGVSQGLFAHYFGDKDGLLEATLRSMAARLGRSAAARRHESNAIRGAPSPTERSPVSTEIGVPWRSLPGLSVVRSSRQPERIARR